MRRRKNTANVRGLSLCCIPKNASTAIKYAILTGAGQDPAAVPNYHSHPGLHLSKPWRATGYTAAFLRDPVARAVSNWFNKLHRNDHSNVSTRALVDKGFWVGMSLDEYIAHLPEALNLDAHTAHQWTYLAESMDWLGTVENIDDGWAWLQRKFPWLPALQVKNRTRLPADFDVTDAQRARILEIYRRDHELWTACSDRR